MKPEAQFRHFIITRFNLRVADWKTSKNGSAVLSEEWLNHRFQLFEQFCFPSVKNQSEQSFEWLVFFDTHTPNEYKRRIESMQSNFAQFRPIYLDSYEMLLPAISTYINDHCSIPVTHVITSRLDNDDGIHRSYVRSVQECFASQQRTIVDFPHGYSLAVDPPVRLGRVKAPFNPFVSLIEECNNNPITVLARQHAHWSDFDAIISLRGKRMWLQVIHERNMLNTFRESLLESFDTLMVDFNVSPTVISSYPAKPKYLIALSNSGILVKMIVRKVRQILGRAR